MSLCTLSFVLRHTHLGTVCVVLKGHRLCRDIAVVLVAYAAILNNGLLFLPI